MEPEKILHELNADGLPKETLKAASAQRAEMVPLFVQEIEAFLAPGTCRSGKADACVFHLPFARRVAGNGCL
jgi:hypothetical protein